MSEAVKRPQTIHLTQEELISKLPEKMVEQTEWHLWEWE